MRPDGELMESNGAGRYEGSASARARQRRGRAELSSSKEIW